MDELPRFARVQDYFSFFFKKRVKAETGRKKLCYSSPPSQHRQQRRRGAVSEVKPELRFMC
ncbi:hypothetical protein, partial [Bordetella avium]|uniref:hypothetical protein n=1 Tax=Bordetella avium TaxID=521 RepID=UPI001B87679D